MFKLNSLNGSDIYYSFMAQFLLFLSYFDSHFVSCSLFKSTKDGICLDDAAQLHKEGFLAQRAPKGHRSGGSYNCKSLSLSLHRHIYVHTHALPVC